MSKLSQQESLDLYGFPLNKETLKVNNVVKNRTLFYLSKVFRLYDSNLYGKIKRLKPIAIAIDDYFYNNDSNTSLFVLISAKLDIDSIRDCKIFDTDYIFDDIIDSKLRMLVFTFPDNYNKYFDKFKESRYSEMFTQEELEIIFPTVSDKNDYVYSILSNTEFRRKQFLRLTNTMFNTTLSLSDTTNSDFPIKINNEIFNAKN